jgi:Skp family chaperone for outer membrane proteins
MKSLLKSAVFTGLVIASAGSLAVAGPAAAQAVKGIGVISPNEIVANSAAYKAAEAQRPVTYAQYYQQAKAQQDQLDAQMKPLIDKFDADRKAATPNQDSLQKQAATLQQLDQQGERTLQQILAPVSLSQQYVKEQLEDVLPKAIETASTKKAITLVINGDASHVLTYDKSYDIDDAVTAELNVLLPTAQLSPPPGWLPRQMRERQAQAAAAQAAASGQPAPAAAAPAVSGPPADSR